METDNPSDSISTPSLKHAPGDPDENDNDTSVKRLKTSPEGALSESTEKCALDGVNNKPAEDGQELRDSAPEATQRLDVPSKELQCIQKQVLIERLMTTATGPTSGDSDNGEEKMDVQSDAATLPERGADVQLKNTQSSKKPFRIPQSQPRKTFKLQSSVLSTVKSFLVEMKTANEELLRLPDPSKISLESDSDRDEMDGPMPGTSASFKNLQGNKDEPSSKTYVEMNIALVDHSDSDTSSDDEDFKFTKKLKTSPINNINSSSSTALNPAEKEAQSPSKDDEKDDGEKKSLITELN